MSILAAFALLQSITTPTPPPDPAATAEMQRIFQITVSRLRDTLKDNQAARFRRTYFVTTFGTDHKYHHHICGEINAKNGFGAFGGWQYLYGSAEDLVVGGDPRKSLTGADFCAEPRGHVWRDSDLSALMTRFVTAP